MKAPKSLFDRPGRAAAVVGAVVAVSATAAVALLSGTATATPNAGQAGKCTKNVNVRAEPDTSSQIVALCEEGTAVQVGESRDGFLRLTNLGGWAAQEYVSVNGHTPASSERASTSEGRDDDNRRSGRNADDARSGHHGSNGAHGADARKSGADKPDSAEADDSDSDESDSEEEAPRKRPAPGPTGGGLGGLLG